MAGSIRTRLSYANVMASVAVFLALGGASYAAVSLPRDSVGTQQLRDERGHAQQARRRKRRHSAAATIDRSTPRSSPVGGVKKRSLSPWIRGQLARRAAQGPAWTQG